MQRLKKRKLSYNQGAGFTLIEVLCALMILAIALSALYMAVNRTLAQDQDLLNDSISYWVAQEVAMEIEQGKTEQFLGGAAWQKKQRNRREWIWKAHCHPLPEPGLCRLLIALRPAPERAGDQIYYFESLLKKDNFVK